MEKVQQFMSLTNSSIDTAHDYLEQYNNDIDQAVNAFFADEQDESGSAPPQGQSNVYKRPDLSTSDRVESSSSVNTARSGSRNQSQNKFMSFSDMVRTNADREDDEGKPRNTFAGGETSGLEVTDPNERDSNKLIRDLLEKARRTGMEEGEDKGEDADTNGNKHRFIGKGYRLGAVVDGPDQVVEDFSKENDTRVNKKGKVTREITFWKEGFQVGDGPLFRYDDPANSFYLSELNQGRAPLKLLNVEFGQEVEVNVFKKLEESFQPPKRKLGGFQGKGQRLGSPIPGDIEDKNVATVKSPLVDTSSEEATMSNDQETVDKPKGDVSVQIRYANGRREIYRCFNETLVSELFAHVQANTDDTRPFTINTSFPVKPITEQDKTIKEMDLVNSVVIQRWK